jgi:hypothetical protein
MDINLTDGQKIKTSVGEDCPIGQNRYKVKVKKIISLKIKGTILATLVDLRERES